MSEIFEVDPAQLREAVPAISAAEEALARGHLIVFPTETVYGIAAEPAIPGATAPVFEAKQRPARLTLPVLVTSSEVAWSFGERTEPAAAAAARFWPGPLTLVLRRTERSRPWDLGDERDTIGIRVPDHPIAQALLQPFGALATTSANRSGEPPLMDREALLAAFGDRVAVYLVLAHGAPHPGGTPSTVVAVTEDDLRILRPGRISEQDLRSALEGSGRRPTG